MLEVAPEAYLAVDAQGRVVDWNRAASALFGWTREEALGRLLDALVTPTQSQETSAAAMLAARVGEPLDVEAVDRQGRVIAAKCTAWGVERRGGTVVHAFVRDVSERRQAQATAALLQAVVEGSSDAVITRDLDGTVLTWNAGAERMLGWPAEEVVGRPSALVVPADKRPELARLLRGLQRGERLGEVETERLTCDGARVPVAVRLSPVRDAEGRLVATSEIARNLTEQRWAARTLDAATLAALKATADEARASEVATRRFLADAAHQLRTPMAGIRACAETLLRGTAAEDGDRLLATMVRETSRAGRLIGSLLQMARLDQGLPLSAGRVDLAGVCADEVERLSLLCPELDVRLDLHRAPARPLVADAAACREILSNLGDNARRHAAGRVRLVLDADFQAVSVRVWDDGPGVADDDRERVFERFVSLDGRGGSGLGLPIARALARALGGELTYDRGFLLTLPLASAGSGSSGLAAADPALPAAS
jgi:PAS domain S-box-containing protein